MTLPPSSAPAVLEFLANGQTSAASETMAFFLGFGIRRAAHRFPLDPADFLSCLKLLDAAPALRADLSRMAEISRGWADLLPFWDSVEASLVAETPTGEAKHFYAPKTYALMRTLQAQ